MLCFDTACHEFWWQNGTRRRKHQPTDDVTTEEINAQGAKHLVERVSSLNRLIRFNSWPRKKNQCPLWYRKASMAQALHLRRTMVCESRCSSTVNTQQRPNEWEVSQQPVEDSSGVHEFAMSCLASQPKERVRHPLGQGSSLCSINVSTNSNLKRLQANIHLVIWSRRFGSTSWGL